MYRATVPILVGLLSILAATAIFGIMVVSFGDVTARNFARPLSGAYEITEMLVGAMVFAALPIVTWRGKHVAVGFLQPVLGRSAALSMIVTVFARGITAAVLALLGYHLWRLGGQFSARDARAVFADMPLAPFAWFAAVMCAISVPAALFRPATAIAGEEI